jgi:hypothetical protein
MYVFLNVFNVLHTMLVTVHGATHAQLQLTFAAARGTPLHVREPARPPRQNASPPLHSACMCQSSPPVHPLREQLLAAALGRDVGVVQTRAGGDLERLRLSLAIRDASGLFTVEPSKSGCEGV